MKKFFLAFCLIVTAFFLMAQEVPTDTLLNEDENFIQLTIEMYDFSNYLLKIAEDNSLDLEEVQAQITALKEENLSAEEELNELQKIFKTDISGRFNEHVEKFNTLWPPLQERCNALTPEAFELEIEQVFRNAEIQSFGLCGWRYYGCMAAATAGAR